MYVQGRRMRLVFLYKARIMAIHGYFIKLAVQVGKRVVLNSKIGSSIESSRKYVRLTKR